MLARLAGVMFRSDIAQNVASFTKLDNRALVIPKGSFTKGFRDLKGCFCTGKGLRKPVCVDFALISVKGPL